jgi:hypothetical protein
MQPSKDRLIVKNRAGANKQGLLDLLIVIIRHIWLLVIVPVAAGAIAFAVAYAKPQTYTSEAILSMAESATKQASLIMASPLVIDPVIDKLDLAKAAPLDQVREQLAGQISAKVGRDGLLLLEVSATSPSQAQLLAKAVIDAWRATTIPGEQAQDQLKARLVYVQKSLHSIDQLLARLTSESPAYFDGPVTRGDRGLTLVSLGELQAKYFEEAQAIPRTLQGVSRDVVRQQPSLPSKPDPAGKSSLAILVTVATFLLLLIAVLLKHLVARYLDDADNVANLQRLRAAFGRSALRTQAPPPKPGG